ncbi:hypothetical protein [Polaribacter aestuariivivens]|uniref:hypothetical protein n=1 Tax=Polaribacter aestuariivivens TaxID=2304626 RepID=UPI003F494EF1
MKQTKRSKRIKLGVYLVAPFVAFYKALKKPEVMNLEDVQPEKDLAVYFDFKQQVFLVAPKNRELVTKPTLLFYTGSKNAFNNFYKTFIEAYNNREKHFLTEEFFAPLLNSQTTHNNKPVLF